MDKNKILPFLLVFTILQVSLFAQNSPLDRKLSLHVVNQPLHVVLHRLEQMTGASFAYMSGVIDKNKLVSLSVNQVTLKAALQRLISNPDVLLYLLDNQIIFYLKDAGPPAKNGTTVVLVPAVTKPTPSEPHLVKLDYVIDTVRITVVDTIYETQCLPVYEYDTIRVTAVDTVAPSVEPVSVDSNSVAEPIRIGFYGGMLAYEKRNTAIDTNYLYSEQALRPFHCGLSVEFRRNKWTFSTGVGIERREWNAEYRGELTKTDYSTITSYKEEKHWDSVEITRYKYFDKSIGAYRYVSIYDSILIIQKTPIYKQDTLRVNYQQKNTAYYITIPFSIGYTFSIGKRIELQPMVGVQLHLLARASGETLLNKQKMQLMNLNDGLSSYYVSSVFALQGGYLFAERHTLGLRAAVSLSLGNMFRDASIAKTSSLSLPVSIFYSIKL